MTDAKQVAAILDNIRHLNNNALLANPTIQQDFIARQIRIRNKLIAELHRLTKGGSK